MAANRNRPQPIPSIRQGFLFHCGISRNSISLGKSRYRVGQSKSDREIEAFACKDVMHEPNSAREVAIPFARKGCFGTRLNMSRARLVIRKIAEGAEDEAKHV